MTQPFDPLTAASALLMLMLATAPGLARADDLVIPPVDEPRLRTHAADAAGFAPRGWTVEMQATGDLNADGRPDLAFVLHDTDPRNRVKNTEGLGDEVVDTNPRIVAVAFRNAAGTGYVLAMQNMTLIPRRTVATEDDNFEEGGNLVIKRGHVAVMLHYFASAGGWDTGTITFTFRYQQGSFKLIGYDSDNTQRSTLEETVTSADFLTGKSEVTVSTETGTPSSKHRRLPAAPLKTIDEVGDGMEFTLPE